MSSENELRASISSRARLRHVYLLSGNDPYLAKMYAEKIAKKCVGDNADLNLVQLPENATIQDIYDNIMQFSFTGDSICVLCSNYPIDTCSQSELKNLIEVVEAAPENNVLVLYYDVLSIDTKKSKSYIKLAAAVEKVGGMVVVLNHKTEAELVKILCDGAAKRFVRLDANVARYMISVCSNDLNMLVNELEKLTAYVGKEGTVTTETVDKVCTKTLEASIFDITKHMLSGRGEKALLLVDNLIAQGVVVSSIYSRIVDAYIDIYRVKAAEKLGKKPESIAEEFGYAKNRLFVLNNAASSGRRLTDKQMSLILYQLLSDFPHIRNDVKISGDNAKTALECLITKIIKISSGDSL